MMGMEMAIIMELIITMELLVEGMVGMVMMLIVMDEINNKDD